MLIKYSHSDLLFLRLDLIAFIVMQQLLALKNRDTNEVGVKCIKKEAEGSWSSHS